MADIDDARQRIAVYLRNVLEDEGTGSPAYDDGYLDGLEYALKLLDGEPDA